jgi:hypothetical protein
MEKTQFALNNTYRTPSNFLDDARQTSGSRPVIDFYAAREVFAAFRRARAGVAVPRVRARAARRCWFERGPLVAQSTLPDSNKGGIVYFVKAIIRGVRK